MNRWKLNISRWSALGLAAVLVMLSVILATGTALARYRTKYDKTIQFAADKPAGIYLGMVDAETESFDATATGTWEQAGDTMQLHFSVANGTDAEAFAEKTQIFRVRLIGSLGIGQEQAMPVIKLMESGIQDDAEAAPEEEGYTAEPVAIAEGSLLHSTFGGGWMYCFLDENGEELTWTLEGGVFSCVDLCAVLVLDENTSIDPSFLQLQVIGETVD